MLSGGKQTAFKGYEKIKGNIIIDFGKLSNGKDYGNVEAIESNVLGFTH